MSSPSWDDETIMSDVEGGFKVENAKPLTELSFARDNSGSDLEYLINSDKMVTNNMVHSGRVTHIL